jgi:cyclophilin family peptidyl-prolyl cis-trans isomerase
MGAAMARPDWGDGDQQQGRRAAVASSRRSNTTRRNRKPARPVKKVQRIEQRWLLIGAAAVIIAAIGIGVWLNRSSDTVQAGECWSGEPNTSAGYPQWNQAPAMTIDTGKTYTATIETSKGTIVAELFADKAPETVNNFVCLARAGYYADVPFHRVIKDFMIQTGDPTGTGTGGPGYAFDDELPGDDLNYERGVLAMANAGPNTNGSQFFINHGDNTAKLQKNYSIFGTVTEGMDVVDAIANVPVGPSPSGEQSAPQEPITITEVTIAEA